MERTPLAGRVEAGRAFTATRRVRWGDADRRGRLRLDGIARYLQDVSNDDTRDVGLGLHLPWVVRRTVVDVVTPPVAGEVLTLTTFCGGLGTAWAERRTTIEGDGGGHVEAASLWVAIDRDTNRPTRLSPEFVALYGSAADGRTVGARLRHPRPDGGAESRPWPLRSTDHDGMGHVNNAATWEPVEDELDRLRRVPVRAEVEYPGAIEPRDEVELRATLVDDVLRLWLLVDGGVRASALVLTTPR
ncbi:MAG TPA: acyl-ACP thioesterase domain-containing protein [Iamia sp.]